MALKTLTKMTASGNEKASTPLIIAENLSVKYDSEKEKRNDFKSLVQDYLSFNKAKRYESIWALNGVSFTANPGDILGVIGANGAGKTTLCRSILGLMKPDRGSIQVNGEISSLLSLGTGFNQNLSGRENIFLNGLMLGLSHDKLKSLQPSIEEFTGLGRFLDQPIKHYSSGMKARLGFSIAAALEPDILVIDEVLGTGDLEFKEKAVNRLYELVSGSRMVVVVSHDIAFVEKNCNKMLWLEQGKVAALGNPGEIAKDYRQTIPPKHKAKKIIAGINKTRNIEGNSETIKAENLGIKFNLGKEKFWALKDVNFKVNEQEILGLIGPNGAGKTTLCRALSGLYWPDSGSLKIRGEVTALLTFNLGFNAQLSGHDNIYLNGMMLGLSRKEIKALIDQIVEFSELGKAIYRQVKTYSSGMKSRLGFSIAATLKPDLFVVDEALSTGDLAFREKATECMQDMLEEAKTVVLVTHSLDIVEKACTRTIWLHQGKVRFDGDPKEAVTQYKQAVAKLDKMKKAFYARKDARLNQVVQYYESGQYELAETLLESVLCETPDDIVILAQFAEIVETQRKWAKAIKLWKKVIKAAELSGDSISIDVAKNIKTLENKTQASKNLK